MTVDRDAARTALVVGVKRVLRDGEVIIHSQMLAEAIVDAIAVARHDVPCPECKGEWLSPKCWGCDGSGSVPGPLLIDVMMGRQ